MNYKPDESMVSDAIDALDGLYDYEDYQKYATLMENEAKRIASLPTKEEWEEKEIIRPNRSLIAKENEM